MERKINLEEILELSIAKNKWYLGERLRKDIVIAMKEACRQTLELASERAIVKLNSPILGQEVYYTDKESIKNVINLID